MNQRGALFTTGLLVCLGVFLLVMWAPRLATPLIVALYVVLTVLVALALFPELQWWNT